MILVVSSDPEIAEALAGAVTAVGLTVKVAENVHRALRCVNQATAVVLDLLSPGIDGEAFSEVSAPVYVVGAHGVRPVLILNRIMMPFTLSRLQDAALSAMSATGRSEIVQRSIAA
jgi:DNA-binding NtrC family response regulator